MSLTAYVYASLRQRFSVHAFLTEDVLVISQRQNKEEKKLIQSHGVAGCFLWDRGSNNGTTWSEAHSRHGNAHYYDIITFTTRPKETIKIENPYIRWQLRVENLMSSVSIKMTHLHFVTIPYSIRYSLSNNIRFSLSPTRLSRNSAYVKVNPMSQLRSLFISYGFWFLHCIYQSDFLENRLSSTNFEVNFMFLYMIVPVKSTPVTAVRCGK